MPDAAGMADAPGMPGGPGNWVWLARIRRPQGRNGEVFAEILTDFPEKFVQRRQLWLLEEEAVGVRARATPPSADYGSVRRVELVRYWLHKGGIVLQFAEAHSISDAEKLAGMIVAIPREQRAELPEGEVYIADLVGCVLVDVAHPGAPVSVGEIEDVDRDVGPVPILIVRGARGEVLIPFAKEYLRRIDLDEKRVEMALPEGLVDLNA
jgi:16S rRNA processing protein RimM